MIHFTFAILLSFIAVARIESFQNGDTCGVTSTDFMNYDYRSDFLVAGEAGCTFGDDTKCFCAPNLQDEKPLSEWQWQCNNVVKFGPTTPSKVCPGFVPVAKGLGQLDIVFHRNRALQSETNNIMSLDKESQEQQLKVQCDTAIHPTGRPGDEVCPYSDCDEGGDHSAVCACVDLDKYGMGEGMEWVCMHANCNCGEQEDQVEEQNDLIEELIISSAASIASSVLLSFSMMAMVVIFN